MADGTYKLAPQVIIYDGKTEYVGAATPFTGCLNGIYYNSTGAPDGACFAGGVATSSQNGLMSAADKTKLDGINTENIVTLSDNQTISAQKTFSNYVRSVGPSLSIESGLPKISGSQQMGSIWGSNGISFSNPETQNDAG